MIISLDTETTGVDLAHGAMPFLVTTCADDGQVRFWEWYVDPVSRRPEIHFGDLEEVSEIIDAADLIYLHNAPFDARALAAIGVCLPWSKVRDTLPASHLLASNRPHNLTWLCIEYLGVDIEKYELKIKEVVKECRTIVKRNFPTWAIASEGLSGMPSVNPSTKRDEDKPWKNDMWLPRALAGELITGGHSHEQELEVWLTACSQYANADSEHTLPLGLELERLIHERGLWEIYIHRLEVQRIACEMMSRGVTAIGDYTDATIANYEEHVAECASTLETIASEYGHNLELAEGPAVNDNMRDFFYGAITQSCPRCTYTNRVKHWKGEKESNDPCPKCLKGTKKRPGMPHQLVTTKRTNLQLPAIINEKSGSTSLDKQAMQEYLHTTEGSQQEFIRILLDKRKHDTDLGYMRSYRRFWIPVLGVQGYYRIHPSLNPCGTDHLRWASNSPNCCDGDTEILTLDGWVKFSNLSDDQSVAQYWKETGTIDFVKPSTVIRKHYRGQMRHITTEEQIDILVTPDHRCLVQDRRTLKKYDVCADDFKDDRKYFHAGTYEGGYETLSHDEVTWLCAVQADGSYERGGSIRFVFKKERKIERLRGCLIRLGARYSENRKGDLVVFHIHQSNEIVSMARAMMPDKCFAKWILECTRETLDNFASEVFYWDGDFTRKASYTSSDKVNADWVQILFCLSNTRAYLATRTPKSDWSVRDHHYVNVVHNRNYSMTTNHRVNLVEWDDLVYCVSVPSTYIVIRRNGRVSITGNCQNVSVQEEECDECEGKGCSLCSGTGKSRLSVRACFGPPPDREWWDFDFRNLEKRIPVYECMEPSLVDVFEKPDEPPYWGSDHNVLASLLFPDEYWPLAEVQDGFKKKHLTKYKRVKNTNFAKQYGAGKKKVDATAGVPGAYEKIERGLPKIAELQAHYLWQAERTGFVCTLPDKTVDPQRGYPILASRTEDGRVLSTTPFNYHVSGSACWAKNTALIRCSTQCAEWRQDGFDAHIALEVHDSILFDFPRGSSPRENLPRALILKKLMEQSGENLIPRIPTPVSLSYHVESWAKETPIE